MMLSEVLLSLCLTSLTMNYAVLSGESCYKFRRLVNVTIDTDQCLWENYTEPKSKMSCIECYDKKKE